MAKKKIIRKSNRTLNLFAEGGDTKQTWGQQAKSSAQSAFSGQNLGGTIGDIGSAVGSIVNAGVQNAQLADTSSLEEKIKAAKTYKVSANNNDDLMSEWRVFSPMESVSWKDIRGGSTGQRTGNTLSAAGSGAAAGAIVGGPIGAIIGGVVGLGSAIGGWLGGNRKAKKKANKFNNQIEIANNKNLIAFDNRADAIDTQNDLMAMANFSAYGGPINVFGSGAIDYELSKEDLYNKQLSAMSKYKMSSMPNSFETPKLAVFAKGGKIHIKKANRGKFTDYCGGKVTSECIARGKKSSSPAVRKRATFAANARKWKHADGGPINMLYNGVMSPFGNRFDDGGKLNSYSVGELVDAIYRNSSREEYLGKPSHNYDFTISEKEADRLGYYPDNRGHRDDRVKKPTHPSHPSRGKWKSMEEFELTDKGMETSNYTLFGLNDGGQDPQAVMTYKGGIVLPEFTVTPDKNYIMNDYDNIRIFDKGGSLTHGGNFSNGVTIIGNGGTHEENPMEGVPMGIAPDGTPNLVEQGEVKFNNYVFSNRLFATGELLAAHNLPTTYADHSFADIAERLSRESSERPNDSISKRGLISSMTRLQQAQEQLRAEEQSNMYAKGGHLFAKGGFDIPEGYGPVLLADPIDIEELYDAEMTPDESSSRQGSGLSWLRYAPAVGAGLGVLSDIFGWTNKPDYGNSDLVGSIADNLTEVSAKPIGNYLTYRPLDRNYYINKLNAQAGATRRAIVNQSGGNRATAMAGLLAADYNALNSLGELARKSEEYNQAQRERVAAFNRGTNQFNSEMALKAAIANKDNDKIRLQARASQAQLREQAEARASAGRSANLTNLFDSLGEIGREEFSRNMIQSNPALYYSIDSKGNITYKNGYDELSEAKKKSVREAANKDKKRKKAKGGYLTIRGGK